MNRVKVTVDGFVLTGFYIGVLGMFASDVVFSPFPRLIIGAMVGFAAVACMGMAWRRYWKEQRRALANESMRKHVTQIDNKESAAQ